MPKRAVYDKDKESYRAASRRYYYSHQEERKAAARKRRLENPEAVKEYQRNAARKARERHPTRFRDYHLRWNYGVTEEWFKAELAKQNGLCAVCKTDKPGYGSFRVDHNHTTGKIRGLLCNKCNSLLGFCNDNRSTLENAMKYLEMHAA